MPPAASRRRSLLIPTGAALASALLLTPLVAMQFTREVDWTVSDFVLMGFLLYGACALFELGARARAALAYRAAVGVAVLSSPQPNRPVSKTTISNRNGWLFIAMREWNGLERA